jgi:putative tricarboxylic transport membrane protein
MSASAAPTADVVTAAPPERRRPVGEVVFAVAVTVLGAYAIIDARTINVPLTAGALGPRAMPYLVGGLLVVSGVSVLVAVLRGKTAGADDGEDIDPRANTDWRTVFLLVAVVVVHIVLIEPLGWPVAATALFTGTAVILGARPWWRAGLLSLAIALVIQAAMVGGLGVSLPAGPLLDGLTIFRG